MCSLQRFICRLTAAVRAPSIPLTAGLARSARPEANVRCACGSSGGQRLIMGAYVRFARPTGGATAAGGG